MRLFAFPSYATSSLVFSNPGGPVSLNPQPLPPMPANRVGAAGIIIIGG